jgi:hypothetical protein
VDDAAPPLPPPLPPRAAPPPTPVLPPAFEPPSLEREPVGTEPPRPPAVWPLPASLPPRPPLPMPAPRPPTGSGWLTPVVWLNRGFDAAVTPLGPVGRWLRQPAGRALVGWTGVLCLAAAAAVLLLDWLGWTRLPGLLQ